MSQTYLNLESLSQPKRKREKRGTTSTRKLLPSQERLHELFGYNDETGELVWLKQPSHSVKVGSVAGTLKDTGYIAISVDGILYKAHRLVWKWNYGIEPPFLIDHIDEDKGNNRINNLREGCRILNGLNTSKSKGAYYNPNLKSQPWRSCIQIDGEFIYLGYFPTEQEAKDAYEYTKAYFIHQLTK